MSKKKKKHAPVVTNKMHQGRLPIKKQTNKPPYLSSGGIKLVSQMISRCQGRITPIQIKVRKKNYIVIIKVKIAMTSTCCSNDTCKIHIEPKPILNNTDIVTLMKNREIFPPHSESQVRMVLSTLIHTKNREQKSKLPRVDIPKVGVIKWQLKQQSSL